jgi:hypothetical protein
MAEIRISQDDVEFLGIDDSPLGQFRTSQDYIEYLYDEDSGPPPPPPPADGEFHNRQGNSFEIDVSFRVPPEERLFAAPTKGSAAPATPDPDFNPPHGYDEARDECFCIVQKGGDRTAPMSWALAVVNIGDGAETDAVSERPSNYGLVWIWFDAPGWGKNVPLSMMYNLSTGEFPETGPNAQFSTQALRAILIHKFIEPGKRYNVAVQLQVDTGSPGGVDTTTLWNEDGFFKVWVSEDGAEPEVFGASKPAGGLIVEGMEVYKGPDDSIDYLTKYGIRYTARDAMFWGLGFRPHVWKRASFIPWGADAAPIQHGGYRMIDRSANTVADIYDGGGLAGVHTLTAEKAALGDTFVTINHRGFAAGNTHGGTAPMGFWGGSDYLEWAGLNSAGVVGAPFNPQALKNYRLVTTADFTTGAPDAKGMVLNIESYAETPDFNVEITAGDTIEAFPASPVLVQAFRWHQREIETCELRIWSAPRAYDDPDPILAARRKLSLRSSVELDDATEPDIETLLARWSADDAGGSVLREAVVGGRRAGYLAPFGIGVSDGGTRGKDLLFLSGEGEAVKVDFSENPIAERVLALNQGSRSQGFAVEITCIFPEAFYGIPGPGEPPPDGGVTNASRPRFVPDVVTWDVPNPDDSGAKADPRSIIALSYRSLRNDENQAPFTHPLPWSVEVATRTDQEDVDAVVHSDILPWYVTGAVDATRYSIDAPWVGKPVTIQIGVQPTGTDDEYDVYVAMRPKGDINPADGDSGDAEFAYFSAGGETYDVNPAYYVNAHLTIRARDLARSVVCIGGRWSPRGRTGIDGAGYAELNCRMLLDEVRVFATAGPGALPAANGATVDRDGKLLGLKCLPARLLTKDDMVLPLGRSLKQANVVEGSAVVTPSGGGKFFTAAPEDTKESVTETVFIARGDVTKIEDPETIGKEQEEFYRVDSVASDGSSLTLAEPFRDATRSAAAAGILRLLYYTAFADDLSEKELSIGAGSAYDPDTSTIEDALIVDDLWANVAPVTASGGLRIYSPLGRGTIQDILPSWCRGLVRPRRNPILGITGRSGDIYAAAQGALFQGDDRWVDDGPTDDIETSLRFRSAPLQDTGIAVPLHDDRVVFQDPTGLTLDSSDTDAYVPYIDAWVKLDTLAEYQTIFWVGDLATNPAETAGAHKVHLIGRLRYGTPELVLGSTASPATEKGLYIASGSTAIDAGEWAHIRWYLPTRAGGTVWLKPHLKVNGRTSAVSLNAQDAGVASPSEIDWINASAVVQPGDDGRVVLGASRDSYSVPPENPTFDSGVAQMRPQRIQGFLHSLAGRLGLLVSKRMAPWTDSDLGVAPVDFDPFTVSYALVQNTDFRVLGDASEEVGNKVLNLASGEYGLIHSHPFVSLFHEFGRETNQVSWAQFGTQVYAANGGRPAVIIQGKGRLAGVLPPTIKPDFELQRFPVWTPNVRDKTSAANEANDPIDGAARGALEQINHYRSAGNSFFRQKIGTADAEILDWTSGRYFGFKCFWRPNSTAGRISIWRRGQSKDSGGPFVECRDGKLVFGWYDAGLKKEVYVETTGPVFTPGRVHYIYIRKRFPQNDALEGNWVNTLFAGSTHRIPITTAAAGTFTVGETITGGTSGATGRVLRFVQATAVEDGFIEYVRVALDFSAGETLTGGTSAATATTLNPVAIIRPVHDLAIVRRLRTTAPTAANVTELDDVDVLDHPIVRNSLGFTTEVAQVRPAGTVATGQVGHNGNPFTIAAATPGRIVGSGSAVFHGAMEGMYFQFGTGTFAGKLYRIVTLTNPTTIETVIAGTSTPETWTDQSGLSGGIFMGIGLVKSEDFDLSREPDTNGDVEFLGTSLQKSSLNGFAPHDGEMWTPGWSVVEAATGENPQLFENVDRSFATGAGEGYELGTDNFDDPLYDGLAGEPGELHFNGTRTVNEPATPSATFWCTDARTYNDEGGNSSTQPNGSDTRPPYIEKDPTGTQPYTTASTAANPTLRWIQDPSTWASTRFVSTAFYDPVQDAVSNGGPILTIAAAAEDPKNPSGAVRILLTGLPQRRGHELWVFESLAGSIDIEGEDTTETAREPREVQRPRDIGRVLEALIGTEVDERLARARHVATLEALKQQTRLRVAGFGSSAALLRVARFDASANEYAIRATEETIGEGPPLGFDNFPPPACKLIASSGTRLWYAALTKLKQLDGVMYSKAGFPVSLRITPSVGFFRLASGRGDEITGMMQLDELMVLAKDLAVASATIGPDDLARVETVSGGVGAISPAAMVALDDRGNFLGDRGLHIVSRSGVTNLGRPVFVSTALENYFATRMDRRHSRGFGATINRARDQYVLLTREVDETRARHRISMEQHVIRGGAELQSWAAGGYRFSRYETPNLSAIAQVQAGPGGSERVVGGTDDGFLLWLDRDDTQGVLIGDTDGIWGAAEVVAGTGSTTSAIVVASGSLDTEQEGPRGATVRYLDAGLVEREAVLLGASAGVLLLDELADAAVPLDGDVLLGVMEHRWESGWIDCGNPERNKLWTFTNIITKEGAVGTITVEAYSDFDSSTVKWTYDLDLSLPDVNIPVHAIPGNNFKVKLFVPFGEVGTRFDIPAIVLRITDVQQD